MSQPNSHGKSSRQHRGREEGGHGEAELPHDESNWLVSYADMMTLLFGFFVLLYSFSKIDTTKFEVVSKELAKYFGGKVKDDPAMIMLKEDVKQIIGGLEGKGVEVTNTPGGIQLTFDSQLLFDSGSARLKEDMRPALTKITQRVRSQKGLESVSVEGHTDDEPIFSPIFPTNWELSSARAARIVRQFESAGIPGEMLGAEGFGSSRPDLPNRTNEGVAIKENQLKNRRVLVNLKFSPTRKEGAEALAQGDLYQRKANLTTEEAILEMPDSQTDPNANNLPLDELMKKAKEQLDIAKQELNSAKSEDKERLRMDRMKSKIQEIEARAQQMLKEADQLRIQRGLDPKSGQPSSAPAPAPGAAPSPAPAPVTPPAPGPTPGAAAVPRPSPAPAGPAVPGAGPTSAPATPKARGVSSAPTPTATPAPTPKPPPLNSPAPTTSPQAPNAATPPPAAARPAAPPPPPPVPTSRATPNAAEAPKGT